MGTHLLFCRFGGARTLDPMIKSHVLYQLSYEPNFSTHKGSYFPKTNKFHVVHTPLRCPKGCNNLLIIRYQSEYLS